VNNRMPMENIFSLIDHNMRNSVISVLPIIGNVQTASTSPLLFANYAWLGPNLYTSTVHGSASDFRYKLGKWFQQEEAISSKPYKLVKFHFDDSYTIQIAPNVHEIKLISLHRLYMVAAEYYATTNPTKALAYLNTVRNARDIINNLQL